MPVDEMFDLLPQDAAGSTTGIGHFIPFEAPDALVEAIGAVLSL